MTPYQTQLFNTHKVNPPETDKTWETFLKHSESRKAMENYIAGIGGYYSNSSRTRFNLEWDVWAVPDLDYDDYLKWLKENEIEIEFDITDAEARGALKKLHKKNEENLWQWGIEGARYSVLDSDCYTTSRFSDATFKWEAGFYGRNGKHFCLTKFEGEELSGMVEDEFAEFLAELDEDKLFLLFIACVEFSHGLDSKFVESEVKYQAFWQLSKQVEDFYEENKIGKWQINEAFTYHGVPYFRVRDPETGEESMLGTEEECKAVVRHAEAGELLGSFGLNLKK